MAGPWLLAAARAAWPRLAGAPTRPLRASAEYGRRSPTGVLVLQTGPNASVDYYLRPRLQAHAGRPWAVANLSTPPSSVPLLAQEGVWVVICRYVDRAWLAALEQARGRLSGVSFFVDDDLPAMISEPGSPFETRLKVATRYGRFTGDLERVVSEIWVSTPPLAERFDTPVRILPPVPFDPPRAPRRDEPPLVVYHGTLTHGAERAFVREVVRRLDPERTPFRLEIAGGLGERLAWAPQPNAVVRRQKAWPAYLHEQQARGASILLAPLTDGAVNAARAPVKVFDAARLGAVGLYADKPPYAGTVADNVDGRLLPMQPQAWADAIAHFLGEPDERLRLATAAFERVTALHSSPPALFGDAA